MLEKFPQAVILVTGCYAQLNSEEISQIDKRVFVIGGQIKSRITQIPKLLTEYLQKQDFNPFDLKRSLGVGVRIFLPMFGLMGIDWGYGFDPINGSTKMSGSNFHFILGQEL